MLFIFFVTAFILLSAGVAVGGRGTGLGLTMGGGGGKGVCFLFFCCLLCFLWNSLIFLNRMGENVDTEGGGFFGCIYSIGLG